MAIIGFIFLFLLLGYVSFMFVFYLFAGSAFGGEDRTFGGNIAALLIFLFLCYMWYLLFHHSPFTVGLK